MASNDFYPPYGRYDIDPAEPMKSPEPKAPQLEGSIWCAHVDRIPSLSMTPHEIADPVTSETVVQMWDVLKAENEALQAAVGQLNESVWQWLPDHSAAYEAMSHLLNLAQGKD